jgi:pimeloyl-ACP methyl ester carboxylesterase
MQMQTRHAVTTRGVTHPESIAEATRPLEQTDERLRLYKSAEGYRAIMSWYDDVLKLLDIEVESRFIKTRFGHTHMLVCGPVDAKPLILIPGVAGCAPLWRRQLPDFARHFRVYALDIVGQPGRSDPYPPSFLNDEYVFWLEDVLNGLDIDRAHFAGTSVGGWIVLRMGLQFPERVRKIVMLSPTGISRAKLPVKIWITKVLNKRKNADALENDLTAKSVSSKTHGGSFGTFDRQLARLMALCTRHYRVDRSVGIHNEKTGKIDFARALRVLRKFFLAEPRSVLKRLKVPGLLIFGEHEILYDPRKICRRTARVMPTVNTRIIAGAGHAAIYDKPDEANRVVIDYLTQ